MEPDSPPQQFPPGDGEMARRTRAHDWASTPLGAMEGWPPELRTCLALVLDSPFPMALAWGPELTTLYNDAFRPILGEKPEALGRSFKAVWAEAWDTIGPFAERACAGQATFIEDFPLEIERSGAREKASFTFSYSPVRLADGSVGGMIDTVVETTERVKAETALRESEERLQAVLGQAPMAVAFTGANGEILFRNARFDALWGRQPHATTARTYSDGYEGRFLDGRPIPSEAWPAARAVLHGETVNGEVLEIIDARGRAIPCSFHAGPIHDDDGKVIGAVVLFREVSEELAAQRALSESEARQRALIEGVPQLVWRAVDGGDWTWASPQWTAYTGQSEPESHGHGWLAAVHPDDRAAALANWEDAERSGRLAMEGRLRRAADGRHRWFQIRATPVRDPSGKIVEWLGTSTDVEDLRALQDRQRVLLHELQHRVRNTLAVMRSLVSRTGETSATVEDFAAHLEGRLSALARTQMVLTRAPDEGVDLETLVREELFAQAAVDGQAQVEGPPTGLSPKAAEVVALAVHELATNAVKYGALSAPAGRVRVSWERYEEAGEPWLRLSWSESGVRVLSTAPRREGFGSELIRLRVPYELGGRGGLDFRPGGVACLLEFPLRAGESILQTHPPSQDAAPPHDRSAMTASLDGRCILLVEDEFYLAMDAARALKVAGARVFGPFPDQAAALAGLETTRPDCAILDVNLGAGAGFDLADRLREMGVPFLFFTGYDRDVLPPRFADVRRLEKPVDDGRMVSAARELCGGA